MRKVVKAVVGGALVIAAVTACNDDPLGEDREAASYFYTNPTVALVKVAGTTEVTAIVMNRYGAPTGAAVSGTPCDARVSARRDSARTAFEEPERFIVTGVSAGTSCLVVDGGGIKDTVSITVVQ